MGQTPAKQFPSPAAFGDSQLNTIRQAQAPDKIQQQQLPSLNFMTQAGNSANSVAQAGAQVGKALPSQPGANPILSRLRMFYGVSQ